jgi:diacylglycerol kinase (ATP)
MVMKRNDHSFSRDLYRLFIFTFCVATWWYCSTEKESPMPNYESRFSWQARLKSFSYAGDGLRALFRTEHNAWIHLVLTLGAIALGFVLGISRLEWLALLITFALVWLAELFNTCIEKIMDFVSEERHPQIKIIKDLAAAAVLVAALASLAVGLLIFLPKLL